MILRKALAPPEARSALAKPGVFKHRMKVLVKGVVKERKKCPGLWINLVRKQTGQSDPEPKLIQTNDPPKTQF